MLKIFAKEYRDYGIIFLVWLLATLALYIPFWFSNDKLQLVYQNWDGPNFVVIAKSLYNPQVIKQFNFLGGWMTPIMFACNFPLYPVLIRLFSFIGYFRSMLFVSLGFSLLTIWLFYYFVKKFRLSANALFLSLVFIFFPPRWFSVYHVGNSEPVFLFFTLLAMVFFYQKNYFYSGLSAGLAQLARFQAILYFPVFIILFLFQKKQKISSRKVLWYLLIPFGLLLVFGLYLFQYNDFLAYFHSRDTVSLFKWVPFSIFNFKEPWVQSIWLEEVIFLFVLELLAISNLFRMGKKYHSLAIFALLLFLPTLFVVQKDISRYSLWLAPALVIGLEEFIQRKEFKLIFFLVLIPATIAYSANFMRLNLSP